MPRDNILERDLSPEEIASLVFNTPMFTQGILKDVDEETLQKYIANPETYRKELEKYAMYQYLSNGDIFQMIDISKAIPKLKYQVKTLKTRANSDKHILEVRRALKDVNHKELTRDIITQTALTGTVVGLWVGRENPKDKSYPYLMLFDDLEYFFPARRKGGKWTIWCDLSYFDQAISYEKKVSLIENLYPYVTMDDYNNFKEKGEEYRYIEFPIERSVCVRSHAMKRNQRFGMPWNTQVALDNKHKNKLKDLEKVASNKVMNAVAVLTLGIAGSEDSTYKKLGEKLTRSVFNSVKQGLMANEDGEASVVGLPEFAKLEYPDMQTDVLDPDKMDSVNSDITHSTGISRVLTTGEGDADSGRLNLEILLDKIGTLLETIESEVYNKLIGLILPTTVKDDYYMEYYKEVPLTSKEKSDIYLKLIASGYTIRPLLEILGEDFYEIIDNSIFDIETLGLRQKILPPLTSYTLSDNTEDSIYGKNNGGESTSVEDTTNTSNQTE